MVASGSAAEIPICAQSIDPSTFTPKGTNLVRGAPNERLYLHSQHPGACAGIPETSCPATIYIVTGDSVSTGETCGNWTVVKYRGKKRHAFIVKSPNYDRDQLALLIETDGTAVVGLHAGTKWAFGKYDHAVEAKSCLTWGEEDRPNAFDSTPP